MNLIRRRPPNANRHGLASTVAAVVAVMTVVGGSAPVAAASPPPSSEPSPTTTTTTTTTTSTTTTTTTTTTVPVTVPATTPTINCLPPTTTTTTTTLPGTTTTTTTTTTTLPGTTTTTTTLPPLPPCPTTTAPTTVAPPPDPAGPAAPQLGIKVPKNLGDILLTIRLVESGNTYTIGKNRGGASGAYQYIDSTWNNFKGYPSAYLAPPAVQDERALIDVNSILWTYKGDVSMVPVIWYYPRAAREPALMDQVPLPWAGNRLTVREYQTRWLNMLEYVVGSPLGWRLALLPPDLRYLSGIPPLVAAAQSGAPPDMAFPVMGKALVAPPAARAAECVSASVATSADDGATAGTTGVTSTTSALVTSTTTTTTTTTTTVAPTSDPAGSAAAPNGTAGTAATVDDQCAPGADAVIYGVKMQPVMSAVDGVVTAVEYGDPMSGVVSVTISDPAGRTYRYTGFNDDTPGTDDGAAIAAHRLTVLAQVGTVVRAGQVIGFMGDTDPMPGNEKLTVNDEPVWPHIRLTVHDEHGVRLDTDALVTWAQAKQACHVAIGPWSVPADPSLKDLDLDPVKVETFGAGSWTIQPDGTVTAVGRAALIMAPQDCVWAPDKPFGPKAAGSAPGADWGIPVTVPAPYWVAASLANEPLTATFVG